MRKLMTLLGKGKRSRDTITKSRGAPGGSQPPGSVQPQMPAQPPTSRDPRTRAGDTLAMPPARARVPAAGAGEAGPSETCHCCFPRGCAEAGATPPLCPAGQGTLPGTHRRDQNPKEPHLRALSTRTSQQHRTAVAAPEPDQTQRRIWKTFNKPHSPEDIV